MRPTAGDAQAEIADGDGQDVGEDLGIDGLDECAAEDGHGGVVTETGPDKRGEQVTADGLAFVGDVVDEEVFADAVVDFGGGAGAAVGDVGREALAEPEDSHFGVAVVLERLIRFFAGARLEELDLDVIGHDGDGLGSERIE